MGMLKGVPDETFIAAALEKAGFARAGAQPDIMQIKNGRAAVRVDPNHIAWFSLDGEGLAGIERERRVLQLIERHCHFRAPRVLHVDNTGWEVRTIVPGNKGAETTLKRLQTDPAYARSVGAALGAILADQHSSIPREALDGWLPPTPPWPHPDDIANLPQVVEDRALLGRIDKALDLSALLRRELADPVLVHGDLGFWNIAFDPTSEHVRGVFDYGDASFGDRCHDFIYMNVGNAPDETMLESAVTAYEPLTGVRIDRRRVHFCNALAAIGFLGFRFGHAPEEDWCGRTLAEDLAWTRSALIAAGL